MCRRLSTWIIILLLGTNLSALAQRSGKVVAVHPAVGKILNRAERDRFGFFQEIPDFQSAVFLLLPDSSYAVQINYLGNGVPRSKTLHLSREEFLHNYRETAAQILSSGQRARRDFPEVWLSLRHGRKIRARLTRVEEDSVIFRTAKSPLHKAALADLSGLAVIKKASMKNPLLYSMAAGTVGAFIGLASGSDEPGWFSLTAEQKAYILGVLMFSSTFLVSGFIQSVRAVDVDVPIAGRSVAEKRALLQQVAEGSYQYSRPFTASLWVAGVETPDYGMIPGAESHFSLHLKPRAQIDLVYGQSQWSRWHIHREVNEWENGREVSTTHTRKHWRYFGVNLTIQQRYNQWLTPELSWGLWIVRIRKDETFSWEQTVYNYPEPGQTLHNQTTNRVLNSEGGLSLNLAAGIRVRLHRYVRAEVQVGLFTTEQFNKILRAGVQIGEQ